MSWSPVVTKQTVTKAANGTWTIIFVFTKSDASTVSFTDSGFRSDDDVRRYCENKLRDLRLADNLIATGDVLVSS